MASDRGTSSVELIRQAWKEPGRESFVLAAYTRNPFRSAEHGAGRSEVPYLALHPMGFSVPPRLRLERWALTPPFHPCPALAETAAIPADWLGFRKSGAVYSLWHCPSGCLEAPPPACIRSSAAKTARAVTRHRTLRCSDFPPPACAGSDSPPFQNRLKYTLKLSGTASLQQCAQ